MPYKILTHTWRPPVQGGDPLCDGVLPVTLPTVTLDTSRDKCGAGYNYCDSLVTAATIAGFWPDGWPACCLVVEPSADKIRRGNKRRCSQLTIQRLCTDDEIRSAMRELVASWAGAHADELVAEQWAWYVALGRPLRDEAIVEQGLRAALDKRGLGDWTLYRYGAARAARDAWAAWDARDARDARDAWAARDAWDALTVEYSALKKWTKDSPELVTRGILSSYENGLGITIPTEKNELGWAMEEKR